MHYTKPISPRCLSLQSFRYYLILKMLKILIYTIHNLICSKMYYKCFTNVSYLFNLFRYLLLQNKFNFALYFSLSKFVQKSSPMRAPKQTADYINSLDFSLVNDPSVLSNIYAEIGKDGDSLAMDPYTVTSLEKLILLSDSENLVKFLGTLGPRLGFKKLGSRIIESIYRRLFECMYVRGEMFSLEEAVKMVDCKECLRNADATHVLRQVIMLLAGKKVEKMAVEKFIMVGETEQHKANREYATKTLEEYKGVFKSLLFAIHSNDSWGTFLVFLLCVRSQSLIAAFLAGEWDHESIARLGHLFEGVALVSNKTNLETIYEKIKGKVMWLSLTEQTSYFMAAFARNYARPDRLVRRMDLDKFERNSNIILGLLESFQRKKDYNGTRLITERFYKQEGSLFESMLMSRDEGLDTKYVKVIVNFMGMPETHNFGVNDDFIRLFHPRWLGTRAGRQLVVGFAGGSCFSERKREFFNEAIDLFWGCKKWKTDGKSFAKTIAGIVTGLAKKKAHEILAQFNR